MLPFTTTVLIVDDDVRVLTLVGQMLRLLNINVLEAPNPETAIRLFQSHAAEIDLLLSDVRMPGLLGPDLARRLRSIRPELPVILMTGYAESLDTQWKVLQKPFQIVDLQLRVKEALGSPVEACF